MGLPNAGKSSLLNALTNARAAVGSYAFTTLEPNLGDMHGFIIADIPGLIEGASQGRGLGHKFLRHIKRTKMILHCVSLENSDIELAYKTIRRELADYGQDLDKKDEVVVLTKTDMTTLEEINQKIKILKKYNAKVLTVSVIDDSSLKTLGDELVKMLR